MVKRSSKIPKENYETLLTEAQEINKFNVFNRIKDRLGDIRLTNKQKDLHELFKFNDIIAVTGPAGSAKTFMAIYCALEFFINNKTNKILLTKPIVEAGENLGFLPGDMSEKIDPYTQSYVDLLHEIVGVEITKKLFETNRIHFEPVAYMRGRNIQDTCLIIDEIQNYTESQLLTLVTRKHASTKIILLGDYMQNDRKNKAHQRSIDFIEYVLRPIKNNVGIFEFGLSDIMRDKIIIDILQNYEKYLAKKN